MTTANPSQTLLHLQQQKQALLALGRNDFTLRMHRALSWLGRAETLAGEDEDLAFITLWISFNAAYAQEKPGYAEKEVFREFFQLVSRLDTEKTIYKLIWNEFSGPIRSLLDNRYVFQPFWEAHNSGKPDGWQQDFEQARKKAHGRWPRKTRMKCSGCFSSAFTPCATSSCTAAPPGTARSTAPRCAAAACCFPACFRPCWKS